jgi:hypothetical protein
MNAKKELEEDIEELGEVIRCAYIYGETDYEKDPSKIYVLKEGYSEADLERFFNSLNFEYDSGWGEQELFGYVWFNSGTWLERYEYDGSELWSYKRCPEIPKECKNCKVED